MILVTLMMLCVHVNVTFLPDTAAVGLELILGNPGERGLNLRGKEGRREQDRGNRSLEGFFY